MQRQVLLCSAALGILFALSPQSARAAGPNDQIDEVVVTAQKRNENIQDVPIAMTALSADDLAGKAVTRSSDLQYAAPALTVTDAGLTQSVNIRGIGLSSGSPNAANGVANYVDGVFLPPIVGTGSFYDIADVEVLRGPQGTFVGSNSTGGAIFIKSQDPNTNRFAGYGEVSGGNYGAVGFQGAVNLPITDDLAVRVAINDQNHDSYYTDHGIYHNKPGSLVEGAGRIGVLYRPNENFQALLKVEAVDKDTGGYAYQPVPGTAYSGVFSEPSIRDLDYNALTRNHEKGQQFTLNLQYVFDNGITAKSITSYQNKEIYNLYDMDATAVGTDTEDQFVREREYTQEVDILSPTDGRFTWVAGGYAQRNKIDVDIHDGAFPTDITIRNKKTTLGAFGQVGYEITPDIVATVGLRYSHYDVTAAGSVYVGNGIPGFPPGGLYVANAGGSESDGRPTGKANIDWHLDKNNMLYAFVARGYKSGGINTPETNFSPETVWDYEAGWKSTLLDGHLKTQLDGFYNQYSNFQFDTVNTATGQGAVQNIQSATIAGIEAQVQGKAHGFGYDASVAYVHSELASYKVIDQNLLPPGTLLPQCASGQTAGCTDYSGATKTISGAPNLLSPEVTFTGGVEYALSVNDALTITPRLNYAYTGSEDSSPSREAYYRIKAHGLLSAMLKFDFERFSLDAYATNLTNEKYITGFSVNGSSGAQFYGAPRLYGARLRAEF
jgi:iron complex outermembrane receptor protein